MSNAPQVRLDHLTAERALERIIRAESSADSVFRAVFRQSGRITETKSVFRPRNAAGAIVKVPITIPQTVALFSHAQPTKTQKKDPETHSHAIAGHPN